MFSSKLAKNFARSALELPVIDISSCSPLSQGIDPIEAKRMVDALHKFGAIAVKDPRINNIDNDNFLNMMEEYFVRRSKIYYQDGLDGLVDINEAHPKSGFQVGVTPEKVERARLHADTIERFFKESPPVSPQPPVKDGKWRFFWRVRNEEISASKLNLLPEQVVPKDFSQWKETMDKWGNTMYNSVWNVAEMTAVGLDLQRDTFTSRMEGAVQLLAPTGSDLAKYRSKDDILAGFHYGKSAMIKL